MAETKLMVDGHVLFYSCYDPAKFFDAAVNNMDAMFHSIYPNDDKFIKILLFTEGKQNDYFSQFRSNGIDGQPSDYTFERTSEDCSLILKKKNKTLCYIMAGRQIVTKEGLEVLSVLSSQKIPDGLPIEEVLQELISKRNIAVLAWGVGKWFFKRGKTIKRIIERYHSPYLFIGDSSARPSFWPIPKLYNIAEKHDVGIIRGSDPLPFMEEINRVGTFGFIIEGNWQEGKPAEYFRNILVAPDKIINNFGYQEKTANFLKRQLKLL